MPLASLTPRAEPAAVPPIQAIGHYDLHDGELRRTQILPDQPSPPSHALYEALHPAADAAAGGV